MNWTTSARKRNTKSGRGQNAKSFKQRKFYSGLNHKQSSPVLRRSDASADFEAHGGKENGAFCDQRTMQQSQQPYGQHKRQRLDYDHSQCQSFQSQNGSHTARSSECAPHQWNVEPSKHNQRERPNMDLSNRQASSLRIPFPVEPVGRSDSEHDFRSMEQHALVTTRAVPSSFRNQFEQNANTSVENQSIQYDRRQTRGTTNINYASPPPKKVKERCSSVLDPFSYRLPQMSNPQPADRSHEETTLTTMQQTQFRHNASDRCSSILNPFSCRPPLLTSKPQPTSGRWHQEETSRRRSHPFDIHPRLDSPPTDVEMFHSHNTLNGPEIQNHPPSQHFSQAFDSWNQQSIPQGTTDNQTQPKHSFQGVAPLITDAQQIRRALPSHDHDAEKTQSNRFAWRRGSDLHTQSRSVSKLIPSFPEIPFGNEKDSTPSNVPLSLREERGGTDRSVGQSNQQLQPPGQRGAENSDFETMSKLKQSSAQVNESSRQLDLELGPVQRANLFGHHHDLLESETPERRTEVDHLRMFQRDETEDIDSVCSGHTDILFFDQGVSILESGEPTEPFTFVGIYYEKDFDSINKTELGRFHDIPQTTSNEQMLVPVDANLFSYIQSCLENASQIMQSDVLEGCNLVDELIKNYLKPAQALAPNEPPIEKKQLSPEQAAKLIRFACDKLAWAFDRHADRNILNCVRSLEKCMPKVTSRNLQPVTEFTGAIQTTDNSGTQTGETTGGPFYGGRVLSETGNSAIIPATIQRMQQPVFRPDCEVTTSKASIGIAPVSSRELAVRPHPHVLSQKPLMISKAIQSQSMLVDASTQTFNIDINVEPQDAKTKGLEAGLQTDCQASKNDLKKDRSLSSQHQTSSPPLLSLRPSPASADNLPLELVPFIHRPFSGLDDGKTDKQIDFEKRHILHARQSTSSSDNVPSSSSNDTQPRVPNKSASFDGLLNANKSTLQDQDKEIDAGKSIVSNYPSPTYVSGGASNDPIALNNPHIEEQHNTTSGGACAPRPNLFLPCPHRYSSSDSTDEILRPPSQNSNTNDPFNLARFTDKQKGDFSTARLELMHGKKETSWMWWIFPTPPFSDDGLEVGSLASRTFSIRSDVEGQAYLNFKQDGLNLRSNYKSVISIVHKHLSAGFVSARGLMGSDIDVARLEQSSRFFQKIASLEGDQELRDLCSGTCSILSEATHQHISTLQDLPNKTLPLAIDRAMPEKQVPSTSCDMYPSSTSTDLVIRQQPPKVGDPPRGALNKFGMIVAPLCKDAIDQNFKHTQDLQRSFVLKPATPSIAAGCALSVVTSARINDSLLQEEFVERSTTSDLFADSAHAVTVAQVPKCAKDLKRSSELAPLGPVGSATLRQDNSIVGFPPLWKSCSDIAPIQSHDSQPPSQVVVKRSPFTALDSQSAKTKELIGEPSCVEKPKRSNVSTAPSCTVMAVQRKKDLPFSTRLDSVAPAESTTLSQDSVAFCSASIPTKIHDSQPSSQNAVNNTTRFLTLDSQLAKANGDVGLPTEVEKPKKSDLSTTRSCGPMAAQIPNSNTVLPISPELGSLAPATISEDSSIVGFPPLWRPRKTITPTVKIRDLQSKTPFMALDLQLSGMKDDVCASTFISGPKKCDLAATPSLSVTAAQAVNSTDDLQSSLGLDSLVAEIAKHVSAGASLQNKNVERCNEPSSQEEYATTEKERARKEVVANEKRRVAEARKMAMLQQQEKVAKRKREEADSEGATRAKSKKTPRSSQESPSKKESSNTMFKISSSTTTASSSGPISFPPLPRSCSIPTKSHDDLQPKCSPFPALSSQPVAITMKHTSANPDQTTQQVAISLIRDKQDSTSLISETAKHLCSLTPSEAARNGTKEINESVPNISNLKAQQQDNNIVHSSPQVKETAANVSDMLATKDNPIATLDRFNLTAAKGPEKSVGSSLILPIEPLDLQKEVRPSLLFAVDLHRSIAVETDQISTKPISSAQRCSQSLPYSYLEDKSPKTKAGAATKSVSSTKEKEIARKKMVMNEKRRVAEARKVAMLQQQQKIIEKASKRKRKQVIDPQQDGAMKTVQIAKNEGATQRPVPFSLPLPIKSPDEISKFTEPHCSASMRQSSALSSAKQVLHTQSSDFLSSVSVKKKQSPQLFPPLASQPQHVNNSGQYSSSKEMASASNQEDGVHLEKTTKERAAVQPKQNQRSPRKLHEHEKVTTSNMPLTSIGQSMSTSKPTSSIKHIDQKLSPHNPALATQPVNHSKSPASSRVAPAPSIPSWNFECVREQEHAERERIKKMGIIPAFDADILALAENYGKMAKEGKAYLATLSDDSEESVIKSKEGQAASSPLSCASSDYYSAAEVGREHYSPLTLDKLLQENKFEAKQVVNVDSTKTPTEKKTLLDMWNDDGDSDLLGSSSDECSLPSSKVEPQVKATKPEDSPRLIMLRRKDSRLSKSPEKRSDDSIQLKKKTALHMLDKTRLSDIGGYESEGRSPAAKRKTATQVIFLTHKDRFGRRPAPRSFPLSTVVKGVRQNPLIPQEEAFMSNIYDTNDAVTTKPPKGNIDGKQTKLSRPPTEDIADLDEDIILSDEDDLMATRKHTTEGPRPNIWDIDDAII